ncbi:hypothetical protein PMI07_000866 [Rhizobium sp. CF080]|uniref:hypothetical protein n=1 Tax=Rhizobium sp. (strain CF080) TaxID=1144310 RepID=UPI000271CD16|nr:hypothetical protein [Rhizobium sp. CF080]EUB97290.1 hypothetical protein PMI07_000866 [Rhizobium sp. CF080]
MAIAFDTLGYAKRLRDVGVEQKLAEAHAEAARDFIMAELVTKSDLTAALDAVTLRLTVRLGSMLFVAVSALAVLTKLN